MKHLDLFSGYGGFTLAMQMRGHETVGFSEIDRYADAVLKYNFPNIKNYGDITKLKGTDLPIIDIVTGGSPCQDLSIAGKGAGLDGARSGLFFHFVRLIKEIQPTYFIWENVKGALSSSRGWDFARVQIEMEQAGYNITWQVLNAKNFGVPQNRERIFAIGTREESSGKVFHITGNTRQNLQELTNKVSDAQRVYTTNISKSLKALGGGLGAKTGLYAIDMSTKSPQLSTNIRALQARYNKGYSHQSAEVSGVLDNMCIRRLTPLECERLMGLPDNWTAKGVVNGKEIEISDTQRYKMCGNGVVVNVVDKLLELINQC